MGVASNSRLSVLLKSNIIYIARADGIVCSYEMRLPTSGNLFLYHNSKKRIETIK